MANSLNKLKLKVSPTLWFEVQAKQNYTLSPYVYALEGEVKYPGKEIVAGVSLQEPRANAKEYDGLVFGQWDAKRAQVAFNIARGNLANIDYTMEATATVTGLEPVNLNAHLILYNEKKSANMRWQYGAKNYEALVEYYPGEKVKGHIQMDAVKYEGTITMKNTNVEKAIIVDLKAERHIYLVAQVRMLKIFIRWPIFLPILHIFHIKLMKHQRKIIKITVNGDVYFESNPKKPPENKTALPSYPF